MEAYLLGVERLGRDSIRRGAHSAGALHYLFRSDGAHRENLLLLTPRPYLYVVADTRGTHQYVC